MSKQGESTTFTRWEEVAEHALWMASTWGCAIQLTVSFDRPAKERDAIATVTAVATRWDEPTEHPSGRSKWGGNAGYKRAPEAFLSALIDLHAAIGYYIEQAAAGVKHKPSSPPR